MSKARWVVHRAFVPGAIQLCVWYSGGHLPAACANGVLRLAGSEILTRVRIPQALSTLTEDT